MHDCTIWTGFKSRDGYGLIHRGGKLLKAHRVAYCKANSLQLEDIKGVVIRHKCDNRACVNPEHLEPGTNQDNTSDRHTRGRDARGSGNGMSKLTESDVLAIRAEFVAWSRTHGGIPLAKRYGVSVSLIRQIARREIWEHV